MGSLGNNCFFLSDSVIYSASATAPAFDGQPLGMTYTKKKINTIQYTLQSVMKMPTEIC